MSGDTAVAMMRAILLGQAWPPEGIEDTAVNRALWDEITADIRALPSNVIPEIPFEWPDGNNGKESE